MGRHEIVARTAPLAATATLLLLLLPPAVAAAAEETTAGSRPDDPAEAALRRVLRSGCRDGVAEVRASGASWAATVERLCTEILRAPAAVAPAPAAQLPDAAATAARPAVVYDGRGLIVAGSTLYGIWLGIATDVLFEVDGVRSAIIPPLVGMTAGLGLSLVATGDHPLTNSQSWTIVTGLEYGSLNGALWAGAFDLNAQGVVGASVATGLTGGAVGLLVAVKREPHAGDIELVRSGLLWGTATGLLATALFSPDSDAEIYWRSAGAAMDAGFIAGVAMAGSFDLSRNRVLIIDASTLGGGLAGAGIAWLIAGGPNAHGRVLAGAGLGGLYAGMVLGALLTRGMESGGDLARGPAPSIPALYARDARGRWTPSLPAPLPLVDQSTNRVVGATLTALGGTF